MKRRQTSFDTAFNSVVLLQDEGLVGLSLCCFCILHEVQLNQIILWKWNHIGEHMRADRGDQDSNICSVTQGGKWILAPETEEHRWLFNATHSLTTTSMEKHVFYCQGDENERLCSNSLPSKDSEEALFHIRDHREKNLCFFGLGLFRDLIYWYKRIFRDESEVVVIWSEEYTVNLSCTYVRCF